MSLLFLLHLTVLAVCGYQQSVSIIAVAISTIDQHTQPETRPVAGQPSSPPGSRQLG
jgi:hypothetical protein